MKKFFLLTAIAGTLLSYSCTRQELAGPEDTGLGSTVAVGLPLQSDETKTCLGDKESGAYKVLWSEGDRIALNGAVSEALTAGQATGSVAKFNVNYPFAAPYRIVYPASVLTENGEIEFPADQTFVQGQFDPSADILLGSSSSDPVMLSHACSFVKVTLAKGGDETLRRVKLYAQDDSPMGGTYTPDYSSATITYKENGRNYVTVSGAPGIAYNAQDKAEIIFSVPAGTYGKGFAVAATTTDGRQMGRKAYGTSGVTLTAGQMIAMPELTFTDDGIPFSGGEGTSANPYRIATSEDLQSLADFCNTDASYASYSDRYYVQVADIDMKDVVIDPICNGTNPFRGSYAGNGHYIDNMAPTATSIANGMFGTLEDATVKDINLNECTFDGSSYVGTVASVMTSGKITGINVTASKVSATTACGGGIIARMKSGEISSCHVDSTSSISGKGNIGGISGQTYYNVSGGTCLIKDNRCDAELDSTSNYTGGIVGYASTDDGTSSTVLIDSCISSGNINGVQSVGGIVGYVRAYTTVKITSCKSYGNVTGTSYYIGGIVGYGAAKEVYYIDRCAAYGNIKGLYCVSGIVGCQVPNGTDAKMVVANCIYAGEELEATGNNGSNGYALVGGITGWWNHKSGYMRIVNCAALFNRIKYVSTYSSYPTKNVSVGGIIGFQNGTVGTDCHIKGCYSLLQPNGILTNGDNLIAANCWDKSAGRGANLWAPSGSQYTPYFGPIYGKCSSGLVYDNCYRDGSNGWWGPGTLTAATNMGAFGPFSTLKDQLNNFKNGYSDFPLVEWSIDERGYPTPGISSKSIFPQPIRVSVIGDSISTFAGWIPMGNSIYYHRGEPVSGSVLDFSDLGTYWNRLIYAYLPYARFEKNIAWSASTVTSYDTDVLKNGRPGFAQRLETQGIGAPDLVLIHGGTNDRSRGSSYNSGTAGYTQPMYNTGTYLYTQEVPASALELLYAKPAESQDISRFLDANVKMVQRIHAMLPNAKIVFVCGDCIEVPMANGLMHIAEHYDFVRCVNFREKGYNWLPKYAGSHPTKAGHDTMASTIYNEIGKWLLEGTSSSYGSEGNVTGDSNEDTFNF